MCSVEVDESVGFDPHEADELLVGAQVGVECGRSLLYAFFFFDEGESVEVLMFVVEIIDFCQVG